VPLSERKNEQRAQKKREKNIYAGAQKKKEGIIMNGN